MKEFSDKNMGPENLEKESSKEKWFKRTKSFPDLQIYEWIGVNNAHEIDKKIRNQLKPDFLKAKAEDNREFLDKFRLNYPAIEKAEIDFVEEARKMSVLKKEIKEKETDETVEMAYCCFIDDAILKMEMLQAVKKRDDKRYSELSKKIYGEPDKEIFDFTLNEAFNKINQFSNDPRPEVQKAYANLKEKINISNEAKKIHTDFKFGRVAN